MRIKHILTGLALTALLSASTYSQNSRVQFNSLGWDFGEMSDAEGAVEHVYSFRNVSSSAVKIGSVSVNCGCLELDWPREAVPPGKTADIVMRFFPAGNGGEVIRSAEVFDDRGERLATLTMTAFVETEYAGLEDAYPVTLLPGLAAQREKVSFGYMVPCSRDRKAVRLANLTDSVLTLKAICEDPSSMLSIECPGCIGPRSEAVMVLEYRIPCEEGLCGTAYDRVLLMSGGKMASKALLADCIYLEKPSAEGPVPVLRTYPSVAPLEKSWFSRTYSGSVLLENAGDAPLEIRKVISDAVLGLSDGTILAPGEKIRVKASSAQTQFRAELFTNDPKRPYKELIFKLTQ